MNLVVSSQNLINWKSCKTISANLMKAWNADEIIVFGRLSKLKTFDLAREIFSKRPDTIIFIDHLPHPGPLIRYVHQIYKVQGVTLPDLVIHMYGDFTMNFSNWKDIEEELRDFRVRIIAPSHKQQKLLSKFMNVEIEVIPFPVTNEFSADQRISMREKYGLKNDDHVFLYTGRLSRQKSILELMNIFAGWCKAIKPNAYLFLAGEFDDFGKPYLNQLDGINQYYTEFLALLTSLPDDIRAKIKYCGQLNSEDLRNLYSASDTFISLSLHHDEDFGMSPGEAGCSGLPLILTDWGGYHSFGGDLIPVTIHGGPSFKTEDVLQSISKALMKGFNDRETAAANFSRNFSVKAVSEKLKARKTNAFLGFTPLFHQLSELETNGVKNIFKDQKIYREVYEAYI